MPINSTPPDWWPQFLTALYVLILSVWGGTVHTIKKVRDKTIDRFTFREWFYDIITSGFVGVITYALCQYAEFDGWLSAALIGIASHQGTRALLLLENEITKRISGGK